MQYDLYIMNVFSPAWFCGNGKNLKFLTQFLIVLVLIEWPDGPQLSAFL